jgi:hypothetical protein
LNKLEEVVSGIPPLDIDILVAVKRSWGCKEGGSSTFKAQKTREIYTHVSSKPIGFNFKEEPKTLRSSSRGKYIRTSSDITPK